jgi:protein-S-isoprenylcysteine O-methyltransferase Ste14
MPVNFPQLLIGIIVAVYWARVIRLARKIRRRTEHSANVIPPGKWGQITRAIWFPVVLLWILIPLTGSFIQWPSLVLTPLFESVPLQYAALFVTLIAFILTWICWNKMGKSWRMGIDPAEKTSLITTGPYSRIRHPIYALSSILMLATAWAIPSPLMLLVAAIHLSLLQLEARREENHLITTHGDVYVEYLSRTGRFLPKMA